MPINPNATVHPYAVAMYGYNAAIYVSNGQQYDRLFYGPSVGPGFDVHTNKPGARGYWAIAILVPLRGPDVQNYINTLRNSDGVSFSNDLIPIAFSLGYKFILY